MKMHKKKFLFNSSICCLLLLLLFSVFTDYIKPQKLSLSLPSCSEYIKRLYLTIIHFTRLLFSIMLNHHDFDLNHLPLFISFLLASSSPCSCGCLGYDEVRILRDTGSHLRFLLSTLLWSVSVINADPLSTKWRETTERDKPERARDAAWTSSNSKYTDRSWREGRVCLFAIYHSATNKRSENFSMGPGK